VTGCIGPARQSEGFSVADVAALDVDFSEVVEHGPLNGRAMLVVASFFMLREADLAAATIDHLHIDLVKQVMTLTLSVSKDDVKALGVQRSWGCVCLGVQRVPCPFCIMHVHFEHLSMSFGKPPLGE
jgi:hypothetical protein